jgi:hypothetical protein
MLVVDDIKNDFWKKAEHSEVNSFGYLKNAVG